MRDLSLSLSSLLRARRGLEFLLPFASNAKALGTPNALVAPIHTTLPSESKKGRIKEPLARRDDGERRRASEETTSTSARPTTTKPELVDRFAALMTPQERKQAALQDVIRDFQRFPGDTGSSEVQVALLTNKISFLAEHLKVHRKDYSSKRGLLAMLNQRRQTLQYLRRSDFERYEFCLDKLGLKDLGKTYDRLSARYD